MTHTVLQVPVPDAAGLVDGQAPNPHVTLLGPFLSEAELSGAERERLRGFFAEVPAFSFDLVAIGQFPDGTTYLAPEPSSPFPMLTAGLFANYPSCPPYGGAFDEVIPHLSLGRLPVRQVEAAIGWRLPLRAAARVVELVRYDAAGVQVLERFPFAD